MHVAAFPTLQASFVPSPPSPCSELPVSPSPNASRQHADTAAQHLHCLSMIPSDVGRAPSSTPRTSGERETTVATACSTSTSTYATRQRWVAELLASLRLPAPFSRVLALSSDSNGPSNGSNRKTASKCLAFTLVMLLRRDSVVVRRLCLFRCAAL